MTPSTPITIRMDGRDNVAIVANDGGLPAGTVLSSGLVLRDKVPQGHKVALTDLPAQTPVLRYGIAIGYALHDIPAGSWVHEGLLRMPGARALTGLPIATLSPPPQAPLTGYTFEGYRNADGSVGTRNILAITTTVQCVAGVVAQAVAAVRNADVAIVVAGLSPDLEGEALSVSVPGFVGGDRTDIALPLPQQPHAGRQADQHQRHNHAQQGKVDLAIKADGPAVGCGVGRDHFFAAAVVPGIEHKEDDQQRTHEEKRFLEDVAHRPEEIHALQEAQEERWVTQRRERTAGVADDEDEEHHHVHHVAAVVVGTDQRPDQQHRSAGGAHDAGQHRA